MKNKRPLLPEKDLEIGGVYMGKINEVVIFLGKSKERGFLVYQVGSKFDSYQEAIDRELKAFDRPALMPYFHYLKHLTAVAKVGHVTLPLGLVRMYEDCVKRVQNSAMAWNTATCEMRRS